MLNSNVTGGVEPEWQPAFQACGVTGDANANILNGYTSITSGEHNLRGA